ncbi:transport inhibitor response 1-like protein [Musa troglodytarum]|uniref:Transport inhibitor response 1-like protein n=1 Tax=Musa troglodytarum TaxID=320322 RepID=A0A9E7FZN1_9LILI|nr:transport inhibitor response 1-like protein [Musa troglodytarum]
MVRGFGWAAAFPDEVWEHVFSFLAADADRNAVALVCRAWHRIERRSRRRVFVGNCYAVAPAAAVRRFPEVRAAAIKGKPHFADFNLVPTDWGGGAEAWVEAMAEGWPHLEELRLKRMVVSDDCLELIARSFKNFGVLSLVSCDGFSTAGLAAIAANCRSSPVHTSVGLEVAILVSVASEGVNELSLVYLLLSSADIPYLRCPNLKTLRLNHAMPLEKLVSLLQRAPQLVDVGTSKFSADHHPELFSKLESTFAGFKHLKSLSEPRALKICQPVQKSATIMEETCFDQVMDLIEDNGLIAVAASCKLLQELRVFPSDPYGVAPPISLTEHGLVAISAGCLMLHSVLYFCRQMTNAALLTIANNRPNLTCFRLCIIEPHTPDYISQEPLDAGFSAIVESCKDLRRLSLSGLLTDRVFKSIGASANRLEMLSVAFAGDSDAGLHYILSGCKNLRKLEIRDCPFGDKALLDNASKLETMRSLWMSSCSVTLGACRQLALKMPRLNVEVIDERRGRPLESWPDDFPVEKLYIYRTVAGPRSDTPPCVWTV